MPIIPFRLRASTPSGPGTATAPPGLAPGWLTQGTGERLLYCYGLMADARMERLVQGMLAHMPRSTISRSQAPHDALLVIATDRVIAPGVTESDASLAAREQRAFDDWAVAGMPWGVLAEALGVVLSATPMARTVATTFDPSTYPPTRVSSSWSTYAAGADTTLAPVPAYGLAGGNGDWDWDSLSPIIGSWGSWSTYLILYSVAPNDWAGAPQNWGQGSTWGGSGYYATVGTVGGIPAYVPSSTYVGTSRAWGAGSAYVGSGYYSAMGTTYGLPAYVPAGSYQGSTNGWGVAIDVNLGITIAITVAQRKPANTWMRTIAVSRDATLFDPAFGADDIHNPSGGFGQWSSVQNITGVPQYIPSRFSGAIYGSEVR